MSLIGALIKLKAGTKAKAAEVMHNFDLIRDKVNGQLDLTNMNLGTGGFGAEGHGDLSALTDPFHIAQSVKFSSSMFVAVNVHTALEELAVHTGLGTDISTMSNILYFDTVYDSTGAYSNGQTPTMKITVPETLHTKGIIAMVSCRSTTLNSNGSVLHVPLAINGTALDLVGSPNGKYYLGGGHSGGETLNTYRKDSKEMIYTTADGWVWDHTGGNEISIGTIWEEVNNNTTITELELTVKVLM